MKMAREEMVELILRYEERFSDYDEISYLHYQLMYLTDKEVENLYKITPYVPYDAPYEGVPIEF